MFNTTEVVGVKVISPTEVNIKSVLLLDITKAEVSIVLSYCSFPVPPVSCCKLNALPVELSV